MGRPINSKVFGAPAVGDLNLVFTSCWLPTEVSAVTNAYVIKQVATNRYLAMNPTSGVTGIVTLSQTVTGAGQAMFSVSPVGAGTGAVLVPVMAASQKAVGVGGTGYVVGDVLTVVGGTGTAATVTVAAVTAGAVTGVSITSGGAYTVLPAAGASATTGGTGTGCTINITAYKLSAVTVASGGKNFTTATLAILGGAAATVAVAAGAVSSVTVTNMSDGFTALPTLTLTTPTASQTARKITSTTVFTFEGSDFFWKPDGTMPDSTYAALPLRSM